LGARRHLHKHLLLVMVLILRNSFTNSSDLYEYFHQHGAYTTELVASCCDKCRPPVLRALACLKADLIPCVSELEGVKQHLSNDQEIPPSQDARISSVKTLQQRKSRIILDSDDE